MQRLGVVGLGATSTTRAHDRHVFEPDGDKHDLGFGIDEAERLMITSA